MQRSIRRHQQQVAKLYRLRLLAACSGPLASGKPWKSLSRALMTEPSWHTHEYVVRPARVETRRALHLVVRGWDADELYWPDYRKPHIYYW